MVEKGQDFVHVVNESPIGKKKNSLFKTKQFKARLLKKKILKISENLLVQNVVLKLHNFGQSDAFLTSRDVLYR